MRLPRCGTRGTYSTAVHTAHGKPAGGRGLRWTARALRPPDRRCKQHMGGQRDDRDRQLSAGSRPPGSEEALASSARGPRRGAVQRGVQDRALIPAPQARPAPWRRLRSRGQGGEQRTRHRGLTVTRHARPPTPAARTSPPHLAGALIVRHVARPARPQRQGHIDPPPRTGRRRSSSGMSLGPRAACWSRQPPLPAGGRR